MITGAVCSLTFEQVAQGDKHGSEALEDLFEESQIDVFDLNPNCLCDKNIHRFKPA